MSAAEKVKRSEMTFLEHFEELRRRIYRALIGLVVVFCVVYAFIDKIMEILVKPYYHYLPEGQQSLTYTEVTEVFFVYMKIAAVVSVVVASPWIFYQLWAFISPGLKPKEKRWAVPFVLATSLFFVGGVVFCYYVVLPFTFQFFFQYNQGFKNIVTISYFWNFELMFLLGIGLTFETPILILLLTRLGLVTPGFLFKKYKWAVLVAFIVAAVITPSGDPVTQSVVAVPIIVLYGLGVFIAWVFRKKPEAEA
jgi:sec-independent protein translocase protein TatC